MKSNKDYWDDLKSKGWLDSTTKDGQPKSSAQRILALGYPIIVLVLIVVTAIWAFIKRQNMKWGTFFPHMIIGSVCGWMWGVFMEKSDPNYPGWLFHPWAVVGPEWILTLEDWLFYPVCGAFFYVIFRSMKIRNTHHEIMKWVGQIFHISITLFFLYFTASAGKSQALQFALPAILMFFYAWDRWDVIHYTKLTTFIILFATLWDWAAVTWLTYIPGMAWASQWVYVSFDASGVAHHSSVFLSYTQCPWAWIFHNPIEITPWFGTCGAMFTYSLVIAIDKFRETYSMKV